MRYKYPIKDLTGPYGVTRERDHSLESIFGPYRELEANNEYHRSNAQQGAFQAVLWGFEHVEGMASIFQGSVLSSYGQRRD